MKDVAGRGEGVWREVGRGEGVWQEKRLAVTLYTCVWDR